MHPIVKQQVICFTLITVGYVNLTVIIKPHSFCSIGGTSFLFTNLLIYIGVFMKNGQEISVRLTASGDVDTAYYIAQAQEERGEVIAAAFKSLNAFVKKMLSFSHSNLLTVPKYTH